MSKKLNYLHVRTVLVKDDTALVEWVDPSMNATIRGYVPKEMIEDGKVESGMLDAALYYGLTFEGFDRKVVNALHDSGIFTAQDILTNRQGLVDALSVSLVRPMIEALTDYALKNKGG